MIIIVVRNYCLGWSGHQIRFVIKYYELLPPKNKRVVKARIKVNLLYYVKLFRL
jgi:hypothetical protein